jgi:hypothetical protein
VLPCNNRIPQMHFKLGYQEFLKWTLQERQSLNIILTHFMSVTVKRTKMDGHISPVNHFPLLTTSLIHLNMINLPNKAILQIEFKQYSNETAIVFATQNLTVSANTIKVTLTIEDWPFR